MVNHLNSCWARALLAGLSMAMFSAVHEHLGTGWWYVRMIANRTLSPGVIFGYLTAAPLCARAGSIGVKFNEDINRGHIWSADRASSVASGM